LQVPQGEGRRRQGETQGQQSDDAPEAAASMEKIGERHLSGFTFTPRIADGRLKVKGYWNLYLGYFRIN